MLHEASRLGVRARCMDCRSISAPQRGGGKKGTPIEGGLNTQWMWHSLKCFCGFSRGFQRCPRRPLPKTSVIRPPYQFGAHPPPRTRNARSRLVESTLLGPPRSSCNSTNIMSNSDGNLKHQLPPQNYFPLMWSLFHFWSWLVWGRHGKG